MSLGQALCDRFCCDEGKTFCLEWGLFTSIQSQSFAALLRLIDTSTRTLDHMRRLVNRLAPEVDVPTQAQRDPVLLTIKAKQLQLNSSVGKFFLAAYSYELQIGNYLGMYDSFVRFGIGFPKVNVNTGLVVCGDRSILGNTPAAQEKLLQKIRDEIEIKPKEDAGRPTHKAITLGPKVRNPEKAKRQARTNNIKRKDTVRGPGRPPKIAPEDPNDVFFSDDERSRRRANPTRSDIGPRTTARKYVDTIQCLVQIITQIPGRTLHEANVVNLAGKIIKKFDSVLHQAIPLARNQVTGASNDLAARQKHLASTGKMMKPVNWKSQLCREPAPLRPVVKVDIAPEHWGSIAIRAVSSWFPDLDDKAHVSSLWSGRWQERFRPKEELREFFELYEESLTSSSSARVSLLRHELARQVMGQDILFHSTRTEAYARASNGIGLTVYCKSQTAPGNTIRPQILDDLEAECDAKLLLHLEILVGKDYRNVVSAEISADIETRARWNGRLRAATRPVEKKARYRMAPSYASDEAIKRLQTKYGNDAPGQSTQEDSPSAVSEAEIEDKAEAEVEDKALVSEAEVEDKAFVSEPETDDKVRFLVAAGR